MKVSFLADKYRVGSDRGMYAHEREGVLDDLNLVVDMAKSEYPKKWIENEEKTGFTQIDMTKEEFFEGRAEEKLEPGDMFIYDGQVLAVDRSDRLVLAISESGPLAVKRFVEEILEAEIEMAKGDPEYDTSEIMMTPEEKLPDGEDLSEYCIPYYTWRAWKERTEWPPVFRVTFSTNTSFLPVRFWVGEGKVRYYTEEIDEDQIQELVREFLSRSYVSTGQGNYSSLCLPEKAEEKVEMVGE